MMLIKDSGREVLAMEVEVEHCIGYMIMFFAVEAIGMRGAFCKEI